MDDSNPNAENAIDGATSYAVKNNIGKVTTKEIPLMKKPFTKGIDLI